MQDCDSHCQILAQVARYLAPAPALAAERPIEERGGSVDQVLAVSTKPLQATSRWANCPGEKQEQIPEPVPQPSTVAV